MPCFSSSTSLGENTHQIEWWLRPFQSWRETARESLTVCMQAHPHAYQHVDNHTKYIHTYTHTLSLSLSLSLTHTYIYTHTYTPWMSEIIDLQSQLSPRHVLALSVNSQPKKNGCVLTARGVHCSVWLCMLNEKIERERERECFGQLDVWTLHLLVTNLVTWWVWLSSRYIIINLMEMACKPLEFQMISIYISIFWWEHFSLHGSCRTNKLNPWGMKIHKFSPSLCL